MRGQISHVAVIAGGLGFERAVSLASGRRALHALRSLGLSVEMYDVDEALLQRIVDDDVDVAYVATHGADGEDGTLQEVLELAGVPFVGSPSRACRGAWDKLRSHEAFESAGIRTPAYLGVSREAFSRFGSRSMMQLVSGRLNFPVVVKPSACGSAMGMTFVSDPSQLPVALARCYAYGEVALVEEYVDGVDLVVGLVETASGLTTLPPLVVRYPAEYRFSFEARYTSNLVGVESGDTLDAKVVHEAETTAKLAFEKLGLRDISRADFMTTTSGEVYLLELAISPGLTDTSLVPIALERGGFQLSEVLGCLVERAVDR